MVERRDFLKKAAAAGTGAFAAPMIITVDAADAQAVTSPPPGPAGGRGPADVDLTGSMGAGSTAAASAGTSGSAPAATGRRTTARTALPRTGADIDRMVAAGLAATAGGAALVLWSADMKPKSPASTPPDPEPEA
jgi:hypothetical protein